jgi:hypothetical protein
MVGDLFKGCLAQAVLDSVYQLDELPRKIGDSLMS